MDSSNKRDTEIDCLSHDKYAVAVEKDSSCGEDGAVVGHIPKNSTVL